MILFPTASVDSGLADAVLEEIANFAGADQLAPSPEQTILGAIFDAAGLDPPGGAPSERWQSVANAPSLAGVAFTLASWQADLSDVLRYWPRAVHARTSTTTGSPPSLVVGVRYGDIDDSMIDGIDPLHVHVMWWWGVIDRVDTLVHIHKQTSEPPIRLVMEAAAEVSGWNFELSELLWERWDGDFETLETALHACVSELSDQGESIPDQLNLAPGHGSAADRPPAAWRQAWDEGQVDLWDGVGRVRLPLGNVDALVWRAQSTVLFPWLEAQRQRIQPLFLDRISKGDLLQLINGNSTPAHVTYFHELPSVDEAVLEFSAMHYAIVSGKARVPDGLRGEIRVLRDIRNALAHGSPANNRDLAKVRHLLT